MLSKIQKPKSKQDLIRALQSAPIKSLEIYEGADLKSVPSVTELTRQKASVIIIH